MGVDVEIINAYSDFNKNDELNLMMMKSNNSERT